MGIAENVKALMAMEGITQESLARVAGISQSSVSTWLHGGKPSNRSLMKICERYNLQPNDILSDTYGLANPRKATLPDGAYLPKMPRKAYAPLLGRVHAGDMGEPDVVDSSVPLPYEVWENHRTAYFLQVEGDCMDRVYPEGCLVLIDPDVQPASGSIAVVKMEGDYVMRRLHKGATALLLSPESYNPSWEDIVITGDHVVESVGTVVWFQPSEELPQ